MSNHLENLNLQITQFIDQGKYREAEPLLLQAVELTMQEYGEDHHSSGAVLNELGEIGRASCRERV